MIDSDGEIDVYTKLALYTPEVTLTLSSLNSERTHLTLQENCSCFALLN